MSSNSRPECKKVSTQYFDIECLMLLVVGGSAVLSLIAMFANMADKAINQGSRLRCTILLNELRFCIVWNFLTYTGFLRLNADGVPIT